ncbi:MAG: acyltransferase family protein [Bacilli bacterium]
MSSIKYRPEIDGLRAVAVIPVILFHMGVSWLPGGFLGVDVFFVISGYLITLIVLKDCQCGIFSFKRFWLRRVRRILPVLIVMVLVSFMVGYSTLYRPDINNLGLQGLAALLSMANISHWLLAGNYWGTNAESSPFLHTWSLSVEEQFYFLFPIIIIFLLKYCKKYITQVLSFFIFISLSIFIYGSKAHPPATFYLLPTRAWELGSGCLLAVLNVKYGSNFFFNNFFLAFLGLFFILISFLFVSGESGISYLFVAPVIGSTFIIGFTNNKKNFVHILLSIPIIVYIGKISYSLYIWHWPILIFFSNISLKYNLKFSFLTKIFFIISISIISYYVIERYTRRNLKLVPGIFVVLFLGVACAYNLSNSNYTEDISCFAETVWRGDLYNVAPKQHNSGFVPKRMRGITFWKNDHFVKDVYAHGGIKKIYGSKFPEIVVLGDSHGLMWSGVLDEIAKRIRTSISFYAADGTSVFFDIPIKKMNGNNFFTVDQKYKFDKSRIAYLSMWKPKVVIIAAKWSNIKDIQETKDLIEYIGNFGSQIYLIEQPPELFFGDKNAPQYLSFLGIVPSGESQKYVKALSNPAYENGRELIRKISKKYHYCDMIPIADLFLNNGQVLVIDNKNCLYIDDDHLSTNGSMMAFDRICEFLKRRFEIEDTSWFILSMENDFARTL